MSPQSLVIEVQLHEPRYHGLPEWPPSPGRLFQALVAGMGAELARPAIREALEWLEEQDAPTIAVPRHVQGHPVTVFVPNNDLDAQQGDPSRVEKIRAAKQVRPRLLEGGTALRYVWTIAEHVPAGLDPTVRGLYQFGRGVDPGWARWWTTSGDPGDALEGWAGPVFAPTGGTPLHCPRAGTLESLERRHRAQAQRLTVERVGKKVMQVFGQPPRPLFREVGYGDGPHRVVYELRTPDRTLAAHALTDAHPLTVAVRDAAVARLEDALGASEPVNEVLVGRRPGAPATVPQRDRVRIIPLPSIGHEEADPSIRRVLVEIPRTCPLPRGDVLWAFSGMDVSGTVLVDSGDRRMLAHYARPSRRWCTITPAALPASRRKTKKNATDRASDEDDARRAVADALRHAGIRAPVTRIEVHKEPPHPKGETAQRFAAGRFSAGRLWHLDLRFAEPVAGPLVIGDGRFLGLGVMRPAAETPKMYAFDILAGMVPEPRPEDLARALRRAVMARWQAIVGGRMPAWVSGHQRDGTPARAHQHLHFSADLDRQRLLVFDRIASGRPDRLQRVLAGLVELRAGRAGKLRLRAVGTDPEDPVIAASSIWRSVTPYAVNRHRALGSATRAIEADIRAALKAHGLPDPVDVDVRAPRSGRRGLTGEVILTFAAAVPGPLLLGRTAHVGGGLFVGG